MKKQFLYTAIGVLLLGLLTVGGTYAFYSLVISGDRPVNTNSSKFEIVYVGGGSTFDGPLSLATKKEDGYKKTLKINVASGAVQAKLNLYLQIEEISQDLAIDAFKWEIYGYNSSGTQVYTKAGTFTGYSAANGHNIVNLVNYDYTLTNDQTTFDIYLWLDINGVDNSVLGTSFKSHIAAQTEQFTGIIKQ